ncbi:MAG: hypothetical protein ACTSXD_08485 [Candidatus Heimdallarchaeaceae archaeon]
MTKEIAVVKLDDKTTDLEKKLDENGLDYTTIIWGKTTQRFSIRKFPSIILLDDNEQIKCYEEYSNNIKNDFSDNSLVSSRKKRIIEWNNAKTTEEKLEFIATQLGLV